MATKSFWNGMLQRITIKKTDKILVGNIDSGDADYSEFGDILTPFSTDDLVEGATNVYGDLSYGSSLSSPNDAIYVDDLGNVGIGTTNPVVALHVTGVVRGSSYFLGNTETISGGITDIQFGDMGGSFLPVKIYSDGTERVRITEVGNVGIGKSNPLTLLDVAGTITANFFDGDGSLLTNLPGGLWTESGTYINANNATSVVITDTGRIGIGNINPDSALHANGVVIGQTQGGIVSGLSGTNYAAVIGLTGTTMGSVAGLGAVSGIMFNISGTYSALEGVANSGAVGLSIKQNGTGDIAEFKDGSNVVFVIQDGGNVGIGHNSPGSKLDVKGVLRLTGATSGFVGLAPAADAGGVTYVLPSVDGSSGDVMTTDGSGNLSFASTGGGGFYKNYAKISDTKASGSQGGSSTSGIWETRELQTEDSDVGNIVTISGNQFTLQAGTYRIYARVPAHGFTSGHKAKLRNITDGTDDLIGSNCTCNSNNQNDSIIFGEITIAASKVFEIQHRVTSSVATTGHGQANSYGVSEIYTTVEIWKQ